MSARCSSPGPSSLTMLMLLGTTTVCRVAGEDAAAPWCGWESVMDAHAGGLPGRGSSDVHVTGEAAQGPMSGTRDREDAQAHLVGGALAPHDVLVRLASKEGSRSRSHCTCRQVT